MPGELQSPEKPSFQTWRIGPVARNRGAEDTRVYEKASVHPPEGGGAATSPRTVLKAAPDRHRPTKGGLCEVLSPV